MKLTADVTVYWTWDSFIQEFDHAINRAASSAAWDMPGMDAYDIGQSVREYVLQNFEDFQCLEAGLVVKTLRRVANAAARSERLEYLENRGAYLYTQREVRALLENAMWNGLADSPDIDGYIDISRAFATLNQNRKQVLFRRYGLDATLTDSEQKTVQRAVRQLTENLNLIGNPDGGSGNEISVEDIDNYIYQRQRGARWSDRNDYGEY